MSDIQFTCPRCGNNLVVDVAGAGLSVPCPECNEPISIPVNVERPENQMADINTEVDAGTADNTCPGVSPVENTGTGRQEPRQRVIMRGVVRVLRVLLSWLAMTLSLLGWLIRASFRWIVVVPVLYVRLARHYRQTGEQAYRNKNGENQGGVIREQIRAIDSEADVISSGVEEGLPNGMPKSHSRIVLLAARMRRWLKKRQLLALLGEELVRHEPVNEELCGVVQQAKSTLENIRRTKARRPVKCGVWNIGTGLATLLVIACAWHFRQNTSGVTNIGEAPTMVHSSLLGCVPDNNNNRDKSDPETTPNEAPTMVQSIVTGKWKQIKSNDRENNDIEVDTPAVGSIHSVQNTIALREYVSNAYTRVTSVPENTLDAQWYRYGIDRGVLCDGVRIGVQEIFAERPFDDNGLAIYLISLSTCDWIADETDILIKQGYYPDIRGYETDSTESKAISSQKFDSFIRGMIDGLEARKPNLRTYGLNPPKE